MNQLETMSPMKPNLLSGVCLLAGLLLPLPAFSGEVLVAVAANFTDAARDIVSLFEKSTPYRAKLSYGSTGTLYAQIENGAPFEVFLSSDVSRAAKAEKSGLAVSGSRFTYAQGKLVLWSAKAGLFTDGQGYLVQSAYQRIAIAKPKTAPYGLAAQQVLQSLGIWDSVQPKLVFGDSIAQAFQFVATGNVPAGFVAYSQVKAWQGGRGSVWEIPGNYYKPIDQQAVLLSKGGKNSAALAFMEFLKSVQARRIITSYGYVIP